MSKLLADLGDITNPVIHPNLGTNTTGGGNVLGLALRTFIALAIGIGIVLFFIMLLRGGLEYILAGSDKDAVSRSISHIRNGLIGLIIVVSIYAITWTIGTLLGFNILQFNLPTLV